MVVRSKEAGLRAQRGTLNSTSQYSTTWWSDRKRRGLELRGEPSIPPVNTVPHGGQIEKAGIRAQYKGSVPPVNTVQNYLVHQSIQYHMVVRSKEVGLRAQYKGSVPPVNTVPHGGQTERGGD